MFQLLVLSAIVAVAMAAPREGFSSDAGNIVIPKKMEAETNPQGLASRVADDALEPNRPSRGIGLVNPAYRWPKGRVPIVISSRFGPSELKVIKKAISVFHKKTCVRFFRWKGREKDYVSIEKPKESSGCWAHAGRVGGKQQVSLESPGCVDVGTVLHELMHTLGFHHEHKRADRDKYVEILWNNIMQDKMHNFEKVSKSHAHSEFPYDPESIMHYHSAAFSSNEKQTIQTKGRNIKIGQGNRLSAIDIKEINAMYNCPQLPKRYPFSGIFKWFTNVGKMNLKKASKMYK